MSTGSNGTALEPVDVGSSIVPHVPDALAPRQPPAWLDSERLDVCVRVAQAMALGGYVPEGFQGRNEKETAARCLRLVMMSDAWGINPWQLADACYMGPGGKFGIEGKVAIAVLGRSPVLAGRLTFEYGGKGGRSGERYVIVRGTLRGETEPRELRGSVSQWAKKQWSKKKNEWVPPNAMWYEDGPGQDQKLAYVGAMWWGRRYAPEVLMGAQIREEQDYPLEDPPPVARDLKRIEPPKDVKPEPAQLVSLDHLRVVVDRVKAKQGDLAAAGTMKKIAEDAGVEDFMAWPMMKWGELLAGLGKILSPVDLAAIRDEVAP